MDRRDTLVALMACAAAPFCAVAQQPARIARIGFLSFDLSISPGAGKEAFRQGLRDLGYVEGRNVAIEYRDAQGNSARLDALAAELTALDLDVIVAQTVTAALAAKQATTTIPIVFAGLDPVAEGLVASLARPGGNVTGLSNLTADLVGKRMGLLKEAVPGARRVAVLSHPGGGGNEHTDQAMTNAAEAAASALGLRAQLVAVRSPADLERAFLDMVKARADVLLVLPYVLFFYERRRVVELARNTALPAVYSARQFVEAGGLMAYGASLADLWRRAATYVDRILKGARPGDLPIEQPTKFELLLNLKAADALGITIPKSLLARADEVIA